MDIAKRESQINKIISGKHVLYICGQQYIFNSPTPYQKYLAQLYYEDRLRDFDFEPKFTKEHAKHTLIALKILPEDVDAQLSKYEKDIDTLKHKLFLSHNDPYKVKNIRNSLRNTRQIHSSLFHSRHMLDHMTVEGYAESTKIYILFSFCLTCNDQLCDDPLIIEKAILEINRSRLSHDDFRELARTEPWHSIWASNKENLFGVDISDEQCVLMMYSRMYESAYKSNDPPAEFIINDDDLFDGWMIEQRKQADRERTKRDLTNNNKGQNADEIYRFKDKNDSRSNKEFIEETDSMNSLEGKLIKENRKLALQKYGKLKESEMPDIKRDLQMQAQQQIMEKFKKKG